MYTAQKRAAALGSLALSAAMCLCAALAVTTFVLPAVVNKSTVQVALLNMYQGIDPFAKQRVEVADLLLDLDADIDGLFHWNTKHVYVSAVIEYVSAKGEFNQAVIWDTVVNRTQSHHLQVKGQKPKYTLVDSFFGITGSKLNVSLHWDIIPNAGFLTSGQSAPVSVDIIKPSS